MAFQLRILSQCQVIREFSNQTTENFVSYSCEHSLKTGFILCNYQLMFVSQIVYSIRMTALSWTTNKANGTNAARTARYELYLKYYFSPHIRFCLRDFMCASKQN